MDEGLPSLTAYQDTGVFGPHRWMIRGAPDGSRLGQIQFTSEHDAKTAIEAAYAFGTLVRRAVRVAVQELADTLY